MSTNEITAAVATIRQYKRIVEEAEAIITAAEDAIKAHMDAAGLTLLNGNDYKVTYTTVNGTKFDKQAAEAMHPGIVKACTVPNPSRRFKVS